MQEAEGRLPDALVACVGGGSNAIGMFHPFLDDPAVKIYGAEAGGHGIDVENGHAASMTGGRPGVLHGNRTYLLQDADGQILEGHSISAGLDYPGVGPEHSLLHDSRRVTYVPITDNEALEAFQLCTRLEGIIPALESRARPGAGDEDRARPWARTRSSCSASPAAATRTSKRSASYLGMRSNAIRCSLHLPRRRLAPSMGSFGSRCSWHEAALRTIIHSPPTDRRSTPSLAGLPTPHHVISAAILDRRPTSAHCDAPLAVPRRTPSGVDAIALLETPIASSSDRPTSDPPCDAAILELPTVVTAYDRARLHVHPIRKV